MIFTVINLIILLERGSLISVERLFFLQLKIHRKFGSNTLCPTAAGNKRNALALLHNITRVVNFQKVRHDVLRTLLLGPVRPQNCDLRYSDF